MKASTVIVAAAAAWTVSAQLDQIPACALSCAITSLGSTGCAQTDIACICKATSFITALVPCVTGACSAADFEATVKAATGLCADAGVTLSIPVSSAAQSSTEAPSSSTSAAVTTTEVSTTETTMVVTSVASNTTVVEPTSVPTGNATVSEPPAPSGTDDSAASRNAVALGGLGALAAFIAALL